MLDARWMLAPFGPLFTACDLLTEKWVSTVHCSRPQVRPVPGSPPFNKIFCVGLHKTATRSMHRFFESLGLRSRHDTRWDKAILPLCAYRRYDCFSDGGAHFWDDRLEFGGNHRVRLLDHCFPNSKFILNTRDLESWLVSKMIHAGWNRAVDLPQASPRQLQDRDWRVKSKRVLVGWIRNRIKYHEKVRAYFEERPNDLLIVDFIQDADSIERIKAFLGFSTHGPVNRPWIGQTKDDQDKAYCRKIARKVLADLDLLQKNN